MNRDTRDNNEEDIVQIGIVTKLNNIKTGTQGQTMYNNTMQTAYVGSLVTILILHVGAMTLR